MWKRLDSDFDPAGTGTAGCIPTFCVWLTSPAGALGKPRHRQRASVNSGAVISNGVVRLNLESLFDVRQWRCGASTGRVKPEIWRNPDEGEIVPRESRELVN
jgi:hypothetical protein